MSNLNAFIAGYVAAVLFTEDSGMDDSGENYLENFASSIDDFSYNARGRTTADCVLFLTRAGQFSRIEEYRQAGIDFFLTRQGHGTGFWDHPEVYGEERAETLTALAKQFPEINAWWNTENESVEIE